MKQTTQIFTLRLKVSQKMPAGMSGVNGAIGVCPAEVWQPNLALAIVKRPARVGWLVQLNQLKPRLKVRQQKPVGMSGEHGQNGA